MPRVLELRIPSGGIPWGEKPELPARLRSELSSALADDVRQLGELCPELDPDLWPNFAGV
jgi:hypothetical protein